MVQQPGKRLADYIAADIRRESWLHGAFKLRERTGHNSNDPLVVEDLRPDGSPKEIRTKEDWLRLKRDQRTAAAAERKGSPQPG